MELILERAKNWFESTSFTFGLRWVFSISLIIIVLASVFSVTLVTYGKARQLTRNEIRARLVSAAATAALVIDADSHTKIPAENKGAGLEFEKLRATLKKLRGSIANARYVYTLRIQADNKIQVIADSNTTENLNRLNNGNTKATQSMLAAFQRGNGPEAEPEFFTDDWGQWLSGYAPILRADGSVEAILGIDLAAAQVWELEKRYLAVGVASSFVVLLFLLPILIFATSFLTRPLSWVTDELDRFKVLDVNTKTRRLRSLISEVSRLNNTLESTRVGLNSFRKYIPSELVTEVLSHQLEAIVEVKRKELTVLFTDFEGFTQMSEGMEPSELVELLNVYFEAIGLAVSEFNGTLDKFIGDAVMAFWNAPNDIPNHAEQACRAAHMIVKRIAAINAERVRNGKVGLNIRVGVHTGIAMVGNIGHEKRLNYTAMGDNVNMASRLEALNKEFGTNLLVSGDTAQRLGSGFNLRHVGDVVLKGKSENTAVFEILEIDARLV